MEMESSINMKSSGDVNGSEDSHSVGSINKSVKLSNGVKENEDLGLNIVNDLDSYLEDINDRLTISRMVNDAVIRGMVNAVEQEVADKIAQNELELTKLRETMQLYHVGSDENESLLSYESKYESLWKEISSLRQELDAISKYLSNHEHLSREELVSYFKNEMAKMKRNHDYKVQEMTEDYYSLRREFLNLKERGPSLPLRKDKDFDILRKKIPEVILKLDNILVPNEKLPAFGNNADGIDCLRDRLESLLLENRQLRDLLADKEGEVNHLSPQVSDAVEKSQQSLTEADLLKRIENLECAVEEASLQASVNEDVYKCLLKEVTGQIECISEVTSVEHDIMKEIYYIVFRDAACNAVLCMKCELEDSDLASIVEEEVYAIMFKEARKKLGDLNMKERALKLENEKLKQDILILETSLDGKEKLLQETAGDLEKEKNQFELVSRELHELRSQIKQQQILISECNEESNSMKSDLLEALEQIECDEVQVNELLAITQDQKNSLSLIATRERENRKQMESVITLVHGLSKAISDVEYRMAGDFERSNFRLENLGTQLSSLNQKAKNFKILELQYKKKLEKRCCDLQKAEAEVDLLGDEVDVLLSLLEKIYIALDHYSPILRHYPGIIEILKLVRRELSGESIKTV
ncbi:hypothetical protein SLEP1_g16182 [Rubroshorea leprosula]|uniref:WPP domain-associated protein n=1 Tax=Rubroshorea leprosula TaxID=152421 RepID=A0AAV5IQ30_9ROSI|nr:hypothetical protein SLEP1_g16182 [Rubroshorea leprosula]